MSHTKPLAPPISERKIIHFVDGFESDILLRILPEYDLTFIIVLMIVKLNHFSSQLFKVSPCDVSIAIFVCFEISDQNFIVIF